MKHKLVIALVAILTFSLVLSGCAVAPQTTEVAADESRPNVGNVDREDSETTGYGSRGRGASVDGGSIAEVSNGGYGGNGNAGTGYTDSCDPVYDGTTTADPDFTLSEADKTLSLSGYGAEGALDDTTLTLADMLSYAIQDEYLARAEYDWITTTFGSARPFTNIMRAEETHIEALQPLFTAYGITAPADEGASRAVAVGSLTEAYQAGVNAEVNNIAMYETFLDQNLPDNIRAVFESLMHASENHLRAFQNQL